MAQRPELGVVTPEAVRLEFEPANVGSRAAAFLLDIALVGVVLTGVNLGLAAVADTLPSFPPWVAVTAVVLLQFAVVLGYPIAFETLWRGRTPGKAALGLRVVTVEGAPVRFRHAAIRAALGLFEFVLLLGAVAVITALSTRRHQRLGDLVAGTLVLRERHAGPTPAPVHFEVPAGFADYAATLDPAVLSAEDYQLVRSFLLRAPRLPARSREHLAARLARPLASRLHQVPPSHVSPELFLRCLAARYQQGAGHASRAGTPPAAPEASDFAPPG